MNSRSANLPCDELQRIASICDSLNRESVAVRENPDDPDADELLSLEQIEAEFKVHRATFYRHAARLSLRPYQRPGDRRSYFRRAEVEDLFKPRPKGGGR